jgi:hypothetical protein
MDAVVLIIALLSVSIPFIIAKLYWWFWFWVILSVVLAVVELVAKIKTGKTISQQFWTWRKNPATPAWQKWAIFGGMVIFWGYLLCHLFL